jgi:hypothetical protein
VVGKGGKGDSGSVRLEGGGIRRESCLHAPGQMRCEALREGWVLFSNFENKVLELDRLQPWQVIKPYLSRSSPASFMPSVSVGIAASDSLEKVITRTPILVRLCTPAIGCWQYFHCLEEKGSHHTEGMTV